MYCNGIQSYRKTDVVTSDPVRLVIMCYEGAIDSLKLAKEEIKEKNYEKKANAIIKAQNIINELLSAWKEVASKPESQVQPARENVYQEKRAAGSGYISV